jgi:hypothetical protein
MALNLPYRQRAVAPRPAYGWAAMQDGTIRYLEASYSNAASMEWKNIQADTELEPKENTD